MRSDNRGGRRTLQDGCSGRERLIEFFAGFAVVRRDGDFRFIADARRLAV
jgi:hypothetical protein